MISRCDFTFFFLCIAHNHIIPDYEENVAVNCLHKHISGLHGCFGCKLKQVQNNFDI